MDDIVKIHVNGWDKRKLAVFRFAALMIEVTALVVEGFEGARHDKKRKVVLELGPRGFCFRTYGTFVEGRS